MTLQQTPAPARSDLAVPTGSREGGARAGHPFRRHGLALSTGAALWAVSIFAFTPDPEGTVRLALYGIASGAFQVGLLFLLRVLWVTQALGGGGIARACLRVETVFLLLAIGSTAADALGVSDLTQPGWMALDAFWPISMLGMFLIGIRIAVAGRWHGASRYWPMVAESWAVVTVPTMGIFGTGAATVVGGLHLLLGYTVLGVLVARKEA